jgi:aminomuconate-semialdehyde/2-hydroxymuconate-6-semialdehyde dehydrogenase
MGTEFIPHVIGGAEVESGDGARFASVDPWRREPWATVALGGAPEAGRAVAAARRAFDEGPWPRLGYAERGAALHRLADAIMAHADELARADTTDMGKPVSESRGNDVPRAAQNFRFFADHARLATAEALPMDSGHHAYTRFEPAGVVAAIAPWNFPLMLEAWKIAPALAWGNTVVLKPAEDTPASATLLARLALQAGLPPGVLNVVHGYGPDSAGAALTADPRVDRITFTGESATGRVISAAAAANLTPVSLELGGKGANLVFADADLDVAVDWSIRAIFTNAGQVCLAGSRLYVQRPVYEEFLDRFCAAADALVIGDPADPATQFGPLASAGHYRKVRSYVEAVGEQGGKIRTGGLGDGWVVRPTVVTDAPAGAPVCREEIFGPVVVVQPFDTEDEAVAAANDTPYGLNAMLFTENLSRAHRVSAALRAGTVWANCFFIRDLRAPFGGFGDSGVGREGGTFSREFFTEPKAVVMAISPHDRR